MEKIWKIKHASPEAVAEIQNEFKLPEIYARVMVLRGIFSRNDSRKFFYSDKTRLHDPFLLEGMNRAVEKILNIIDSHKIILVFGDYDVDGTTGTSMLTLFLSELGAEVHYYIPNRESEGYGVSIEGIDFAHSIGAHQHGFVTCQIALRAKCVHILRARNKRYGIHSKAANTFGGDFLGQIAVVGGI